MSPPGFQVTHIPKGNLVLLCVNVFLRHVGFFFFSSRGSFLVLSARGHAGSPPEHHGTSVTTLQVWALAEVRGTWSGGSKSQVTTGGHSEHVRPSRPLQTHVQARTMSGCSGDIWDHECHQCRQTLLTWRWKSFPPAPTWQTCDHFKYKKMNLHDFGRII